MINVEQKKIIKFTREEDLLAASYEKSYSDVIDSGVLLVSNDSIEEFTKRFNIMGSGLILKNSILMAHPYKKNCFINIEDDIELVEIEKYHLTADIAKILGAKLFMVENTTVKGFKKKIKLDSKGRFKTIKAKLTINKEEDQEIKKKFQMTNDYKGSEPDYKKAKDKLFEYGLNIDPAINALVESRNPEDKNLLEVQKLLLNSSSEVNKTLDIALNLSALKGVLDLSAAYTSKVSERISVEQKIIIKF